MQDTAQLRERQEEEQQLVLNGAGCRGEEAEEECWDRTSRNGGAAARAAAGERPLMMSPVSWKRVQRNRREEERRRKLEAIAETRGQSQRTRMEGQLHAQLPMKDLRDRGCR